MNDDWMNENSEKEIEELNKALNVGKQNTMPDGGPLMNIENQWKKLKPLLNEKLVRKIESNQVGGMVSQLPKNLSMNPEYKEPYAFVHYFGGKADTIEEGIEKLAKFLNEKIDVNEVYGSLANCLSLELFTGTKKKQYAVISYLSMLKKPNEKNKFDIPNDF